jgi:hypothetical protein
MHRLVPAFVLLAGLSAVACSDEAQRAAKVLAEAFQRSADANDVATLNRMWPSETRVGGMGEGVPGAAAALRPNAAHGGKKRTGLPDTFRSSDSIAYLEDDNSVSIWDVQISSGPIDHAGKAPNHPNDSPENSTFMVCEPRHHIGGIIPVPPTVPEPAPPVDLSKIEGLLVDIQTKAVGIRESLEEHRLESRKTRSAVLDFLGNWRNYVKIGSAEIGTIVTMQATDGGQ